MIIFAAFFNVSSAGSNFLHGLTSSVLLGFHLYVAGSASTNTTLFMSRGRYSRRWHDIRSAGTCHTGITDNARRSRPLP